MKVAPTPTISPMPVRPQPSLQPSCLPVADKHPSPLFRQLFRSLDDSAHCSPSHIPNTSPLVLVNPVPVRLTPPPSPFSKALPRSTPNSVRTLDTESITPFSSCHSTPNSSKNTTPRSSPLPPSRNVARPRLPSFGFTPSHHLQCHPIPSSPSTSKNINVRSGYLTPPKPFPAKPRKKSKTGGSPHNSNHSRSTPVTETTKTPNKNGRQQKVKTELCLYYMNGESCPYGASCYYAHGEHELQTKGLLDLQNQGLIEDAHTYRIKPCFSHVAMGSCSFGKRCACIHDPRVSGTVQSWLPMTETQGNNMMTDINVEGLHQKRRFGILYGDSFVACSPALGNNYDWKDLYEALCNMQPKSGKRNRRKIHEIHKLSIAMQMFGATHKWMYKYRPSHTIFHELCMVLDKRAFQLHENGKATSLPLSRYKQSNPKHCLVREIAFGPDGDQSVRPVALWFDIPNDKVVECTIQKQKLFRWHKHKQLQHKANADGFKLVSSSPFENQDCFVMIRPMDCKAFFLTKKVLEHRFAFLKAERLTNIRERKSALEKLDRHELLLGERFANIQQHSIAWNYPEASGRPPIDENTPVPPADVQYNPGEIVATETNFRESKRMWKSFLSTLKALKYNDCVPKNFANETSNGASYLLGDFRPKTCSNRRLGIFVQLGNGHGVDPEDRSLPYIQSSSITKKTGGQPKDSYLRQSERCWKSLMLEENEAEWDAVVEHFTNASRSQKVLNIVQQ